MICPRCKEFDVLLAVENYIIKNSPEKGLFLEKFFKELATNSKVEIICQNCENKISKYEYYFDENEEDDDEYEDYDYKLMQKLYHFIAKELTKKIVGCEYCSQPAEIFTSMRHGGYFEEEDDVYGMIGFMDTSIEIGDFITNYFVIDPIDEIIESMYCPVCGYGSGIDYSLKQDNGTLNVYSEIYTQETLEEFDEKFYGKIKNIEDKVDLLADQLTMEELIKLKNDYIENKLYISQNHIFKKLEQAIESLYTENIYYLLARGRTIFRTRTFDINSLNGDLPPYKELWEPPYGSSMHGRYNDIGASVLYCSNNLDVLKEEVPLPQGKEYIYAKFIINKSLKMFPIDFVFKNGEDQQSDFNGLIAHPLSDDSKQFRVEYITSNIVAAICLKVGYNGIAYKSTKCYDSVNYAFLKFEKNKDIKMIDIFR